MKLYIVRHGQTTYNLERRLQGISDIDLNETGIKQANETKDSLKGVSFDLCISPPLKRALSTA